MQGVSGVQGINFIPSLGCEAVGVCRCVHPLGNADEPKAGEQRQLCQEDAGSAKRTLVDDAQTLAMFCVLRKKKSTRAMHVDSLVRITFRS